MSGRAIEEEDLPPAKRLKVEAKEKDGVQVPVSEEGMDQDVGDDEDDPKAAKGEDNWALLSHMREEDVGVTEYISQHKGVSGVIKQRYSDFIVNEISLSGDVVHLTNTDVPVIIEEEEPAGPVDEVLPEDFLVQLRQVAGGSIPGQSAVIQAGNDKLHRMRIHRAVKAAFPTLNSTTVDRDNEKVITVTLTGTIRDKRRKSDWPRCKSNFPFCRFVLYKENKGTMDVMHLIARYLKVKDSLFHYAGTKDRRGKTTQEVTAFKVSPKRLQDLNKFLRNITLGNFRYVDKQLRLGELGGNHFTIVLRNVIGDDEDIETGLNSLKTVGFVNYYGLQRFGTQNVCTHHVGRALLKEDWEGALNLIIAGDDCKDLPYREVWLETKDPKKTLEVLDNRHYIEKVVLRTLQKNPTDFFGAIQSLPRNTRLIYPHSYQSVLWNTVVSRRVKTFGLLPMVGDLVLPPGADADTETADADNNGQEESDAEQPPAKKCSGDAGESGSKAAEEQQDRKSKKPLRAKPIVLTQSNLSKYTIYDVVYPLPGFDVVYPDNEVKSWFKEMLEEDGFDIDKMQRKQKDYSLPGGYRPILVRPVDMEWKMFRYNDTTTSLALSDIDRMNGVEEPESVEDGKFKAVRLSFSLSTSSYATMALREVLKADTSPAQQASMNIT